MIRRKNIAIGAGLLSHAVGLIALATAAAYLFRYTFESPGPRHIELLVGFAVGFTWAVGAFLLSTYIGLLGRNYLPEAWKNAFVLPGMVLGVIYLVWFVLAVL